MGLIDGLFNLGSTIAGGIISGKQQRDNNEFNAQQAQLNRDFQEKMLQKQQDYATDMWNKTNEYNTASAQRQRYEAAGLNPYMMMGGVNAGTAQSTSPGSAPSGSSAQAAGGIDIAGNLAKAGMAGADILNSIKQRKLVDKQIESLSADVDLKRIDAKTKDQRNMAELAMLMEQKGFLSKKAAQTVIENQFLPETMAANIEGTKANAKRQEAAAKLDTITAAMDEQRLQFLPSQLRYDLLERTARIDTYQADVKKMSAEIKKIVFDMQPEFQKITGKKMTEKDKNTLFETLMNMKTYEMEHTKANRGADGAWGLWNVLNNGLHQVFD